MVACTGASAGVWIASSLEATALTSDEMVEPIGRRAPWKIRMLKPLMKNVPGKSIHETGGARMGDSPENSVVDPFNRLWDAPNVVIGDMSCFPSSGYQNPTLSGMALAARAADQIVSELRTAP